MDSKQQDEYMRRPHKIRGGTNPVKNWFYVDKRSCSFHDASNSGKAVYIGTQQLISALKKAGLVNP